VRVFWDTNLFIYYLEEYGELSLRVFELHARMIARGARLVTSAFGLGELLVKPARDDPAMASRYREIVLSRAEICDFGLAAADRYARIRAMGTIKAPDAIQLACAAAARVDLFVTNDDRLSRMIVPDVPIVTSLAAVPI
jgi:predicted nucleic acid-binding protein